MPEDRTPWPGDVGPKDVPESTKHLPGFVVRSYGTDVQWLDEETWKNLDGVVADLDNILAGTPNIGGGGSSSG